VGLTDSELGGSIIEGQWVWFALEVVAMKD
jgi:hypothetical protein